MQENSNNSEPVLRAEGIYKKYLIGGNELPVLNGVNIQLNKNDFTLIMGHSGSGKSTLLHILGGLDTPDLGNVYINGKDFFALNDRKRSAVRNNRIGFIFQFYHLLPELTALENILLPWYIANNNSVSDEKRARNRANELLELVGLSARAKHRPNELSGGEQQRVAVARALVNSPDVVLADEPSGNLDLKTGEKIYELLKQVNSVFGTAFLVVTHNPELINMAQKCLVIRDGIIN